MPDTQDQAIASAICRTVAELPDRNSPEGWPEAMIVTQGELHAIVLEALAAKEAPPANDHFPDAREMMGAEWAAEVQAERDRQNEARGRQMPDDARTWRDRQHSIRTLTEHPDGHNDRKLFIKIAALAVSVIESMDRKALLVTKESGNA